MTAPATPAKTPATLAWTGPAMAHRASTAAAPAAGPAGLDCSPCSAWLRCSRSGRGALRALAPQALERVDELLEVGVALGRELKLDRRRRAREEALLGLEL